MYGNVIEWDGVGIPRVLLAALCETQQAQGLEGIERQSTEILKS